MNGQTTLVQAREAAAFPVAEGQALTITDPGGGQCADLVCFNAADPNEYLSNAHSFEYEETINLGEGNRLWSSRSNVMLAIRHDPVEGHDFLLPTCSRKSLSHFRPDRPDTTGCHEALSEALSSFGIASHRIPVGFSLFMRVAVAGQSGILTLGTPASSAGDTVVLEAQMDLVIGLTACPAYVEDSAAAGPIGYRIGN